PGSGRCSGRQTRSCWSARTRSSFRAPRWARNRDRTRADSSPPAGVDYDLWLGPAPARPFNRNRFHGNWRWFFDYGTGDLGNDGVHRLDLARMALEAATEGRGEKPLGFPQTISAVGG